MAGRIILSSVVADRNNLNKIADSQGYSLLLNVFCSNVVDDIAFVSDYRLSPEFMAATDREDRTILLEIESSNGAGPCSRG